MRVCGRVRCVEHRVRELGIRRIDPVRVYIVILWHRSVLARIYTKGVPGSPGSPVEYQIFAVTFIVAPSHMHGDEFVQNIRRGIGSCEEDTLRPWRRGRVQWYAPLPFWGSAERPSGEPVDLSRGIFHAHGCVGGNDLRTRALGLFEGGGIPFASRVLWIKGLQSQDLYIGEDSRIDHSGSICGCPKRLIPS